MDQKQIIEKLEETLLRRYGCHSDTASPQQIYRSLCYLVNEMLMEKNTQFNRKTQKEQNKQVYYMSMEFLVGTSLRNNLYNLGLEELFTQALDKCGIDIHDLYEMVWATAVWAVWPPAIWTPPPRWVFPAPAIPSAMSLVSSSRKSSMVGRWNFPMTG